MAGNLENLQELFPGIDPAELGALQQIEDNFFADEVRSRLNSLKFVDGICNLYSEPASDGYSEVLMANIVLRVFGKDRSILWAVRSDDTTDDEMHPAKSITNAYIDLAGEPGRRAAVFEPVLLTQRGDGSWRHTTDSPPFPDYDRGPRRLTVRHGHRYNVVNIRNMLEYHFSSAAEYEFLGKIAHLTEGSKEPIDGAPTYELSTNPD
ncbi:MAG TPA: hypothetical protein VFH39_02350 [Candidatus Saccharimonadales bacterium]|nr:hypothetical protein [Candidatus Saccharimonadales bacterium]